MLRFITQFLSYAGLSGLLVARLTAVCEIHARLNELIKNLISLQDVAFIMTVIYSEELNSVELN